MTGNTRWKKRINIMNIVYSDVVSNHTLDSKAIIKQAFEIDNFDYEQMKVLEYYFNNWKKIEQKVIERLKPTWSHQRMNIITKSIILSSLSEYYALNTPLGVIIDQALKTCDHRGLVRDKKFINAMLDGIIKNGK